MLSGSLADIDGGVIVQMKNAIAAATGQPVSDIDITVSAGSVIVSVTMERSAVADLAGRISSGSISTLGGLPTVGAYSDVGSALSAVSLLQETQSSPPSKAPVQTESDLQPPAFATQVPSMLQPEQPTAGVNQGSVFDGTTNQALYPPPQAFNPPPMAQQMGGMPAGQQPQQPNAGLSQGSVFDGTTNQALYPPPQAFNPPPMADRKSVV